MIEIDPQVIPLVPDASALSRSGLAGFLNRARVGIRLTGQVELLLTSDAELKRLNRTFRGKNKPTDILSFPTPPEISSQHAGDLAISLETAARQAAQYGHALRDELRILILHGLLHLSGLDHDTDNGEMAAREAELRKALKLPTSLIARVSSPQMKKGRHSDLELVEGEESPHLHLNGRADGSGRAKKRANGPSHTSLGQRPRSIATRGRNRAEGPIHKSHQKPRARP